MECEWENYEVITCLPLHFLNFIKMLLRTSVKIAISLKYFLSLTRLFVIYLHPLIMFSLQLSIHSIIVYSFQPF